MITVQVDTEEEFDWLKPMMFRQPFDYQVNYRTGKRPLSDALDPDGICVGYGRTTQKGDSNVLEIPTGSAT